MNERPYDQTLYNVAADILESMALMFLVPEDEADGPPANCGRKVAVSFTGPFQGLLVLAASDAGLAELAANMLGLDSGQAGRDQQQDALKELANVVCGNLLPVIAGKELVFHIEAPQVLVQQEISAGPEDLASAGRANLLTDAGPFKLELFVNQPSGIPG